MLSPRERCCGEEFANGNASSLMGGGRSAVGGWSGRIGLEERSSQISCEK